VVLLDVVVDSCGIGLSQSAASDHGAGDVSNMRCVEVVGVGGDALR
jgi:hypothetical protein